MKRRNKHSFTQIGSTAKTLLTAAAVVVSLGLLTGYAYWPRSPVSLARGENMDRSGLYASWKKGEVVVLVRHGERCDRSKNECLGPKDGITQNGNAVSAAVGQSFSSLGLEQTDVLTSPATRTAQTAQAMFGRPIEAQDWLYNCNKTSFDEVMKHKANARNLVLVTHSGCISELERTQGYSYPELSEYSSALFVSLDHKGKPVIRGVMNPDDWNRLVGGSVH